MKESSKASAKPIIILPIDFTPESSTLALSTMTPKEKLGKAFNHLSANNIAAWEKYIKKSYNLVMNGQKPDKKSSDAATTLTYNMKRSYNNYASYYVFHCLANTEALVAKVTEDHDVHTVLYWIRQHIQNAIRQKKEFKIFQVHQKLAACFRPLTKLQKLGVLSSEIIDVVSAELEKLKDLGDLYNALTSASEEDKPTAKKQFISFLKDELS